eukprot:gene6322-biopygen1467
MARTKKTAPMQTGSRKPAPPKNAKKPTNEPPPKIAKKQAKSVTSGSKRTREEDTSSLNSELMRQLSTFAFSFLAFLFCPVPLRSSPVSLVDPHVEIPPDVPANRTTDAHGPSNKARSDKHRNPNPSKDEWAPGGTVVDLSKAPDQALADLHDRLASLSALKKLRVERPELYQTIETALGVKDLGMRSHNTYKQCGRVLSEFHANPETYQMPADFVGKILALNSPSMTQNKIKLKINALVQECADAQAARNYKTCFYAFSAYKAARDLYEVEWSALHKALGLEQAHKLMVKKMKPFGDISDDQWDKLVSLAKGLDKAEKLDLVEFLQADQDQADFVSCINPFGLRIKPNGKAGILADPTITGLTNFSKLIFNHSFNEHGVKATCDVYVDDYPIRADTHADMQRAFEIMDREAELLGLEFNPSKDEGTSVLSYMDNVQAVSAVNKGGSRIQGIRDALAQMALTGLKSAQ